MYATNIWIFGPVCDDGWGTNEANGLSQTIWGLEVASIKKLYGTVSTSDFAKDDVNCSGSENRLQNCSYQTLMTAKQLRVQEFTALIRQLAPFP